MSNSYVFFWKPSGKYGPLSNWSNHKITEGDVVFATMEHYLMYHKALLMNDRNTAIAVLRSHTPAEAKKIGRQVKPWSEELWISEREKVMLKGLLLKVNQNPEVKQLLLNTIGCTIAEASPYDVIWGIGLSEKHPKANQRNHWRGSNLLGESWMEVRWMLVCRQSSLD